MAKIMLVEDDNNLREIYGARLLAEGHEIVTAKDGEEALATAVKEKPDLIISDVMMPRISGFDMLDILRNAPETKYTKVIMMTALSQAEDKARADNLGADRYLVKSQVTLEDVARVVKDVLDGKTEADSTPATPAAAETVAATPETQPSSEPVSVAQPEAEPTPEPAAATPEPPAEPTPTVNPAEVIPVSEPDVSSPSIVSDSAVAADDTNTPQIAVPQASVPTDSASTIDNTATSSTVVADAENAQQPDSALPVQTPELETAAQPENESSIPVSEPAPEPTLAAAPENVAMPEPEITEPMPAEPAPNQNTAAAIVEEPVSDTTVADQSEDEAVVTPAPQINVELPKIESEQPVEEPMQVIPAPSEPALDTNLQAEPDNPEANIGPNLVEALQAEADDAPQATPGQPVQIDVSVPESAPVVEPTSAPPVPEPTVEAPTPIVTDANIVQPNITVPTQAPTPEPATEVTGSSDNQQPDASQPPADNPLVEDSRKKVVIQPLHDLTTGPDLNALMERDRVNDAVPTPPANTVITPANQTPPKPSTQVNEHDIISL